VTLDAFFGVMGPFLAGQADLSQVRSALGPLPGRDEDYRFYVELVAFDQRRILSELYPAVRAWVQSAGLDWQALCRDFVRARPPRGFSVPHLGEGFADWLSGHREREPGLPFGVEAVADLTWTRFLARTAPDVQGPGPEGLGLDRRLFVRHYPIDAPAVTKAAAQGRPLVPGGPVTLLVYRHAQRQTVHELPVARATLAVLLAESGAAVPPALRLPGAESEAERVRLAREGVLSHPEPPEENKP
jgi:hypothetical protein